MQACGPAALTETVQQQPTFLGLAASRFFSRAPASAHTATLHCAATEPSCYNKQPTFLGLAASRFFSTSASSFWMQRCANSGCWSHPLVDTCGNQS